jgi:hypothetical protein
MDMANALPTRTDTDSHSRSDHSQGGAQRREQYLYGAQRAIESEARSVRWSAFHSYPGTMPRWRNWQTAPDLGFRKIIDFKAFLFVSKNKRFTRGKCSFRFEGEPLPRTSRNIVILAQSLAQRRTQLRYIWIARLVIGRHLY